MYFVFMYIIGWLLNLYNILFFIIVRLGLGGIKIVIFGNFVWMVFWIRGDNVKFLIIIIVL